MMHVFWSSTWRPQAGPEPQSVSTAEGCACVIALYSLKAAVLRKGGQTFFDEAVPADTFGTGVAVHTYKRCLFHTPAMILV